MLPNQISQGVISERVDLILQTDDVAHLVDTELELLELRKLQLLGPDLFPQLLQLLPVFFQLVSGLLDLVIDLAQALLLRLQRSRETLLPQVKLRAEQTL